jgi:hypothetical protein
MMTMDIIFLLFAVFPPLYSAGFANAFPLSSQRKELQVLSLGASSEAHTPVPSSSPPKQSTHKNFAFRSDDNEFATNNSAEMNRNIMDIVTDLDGNLLTKEYFSEKMGVKNVEYFFCPGEDAFRGFMSNGCRVRLSSGESAFYKRIVFDDLDHAREKLVTAPFKLVRDAKSYQVVASFLTSKACEELMAETDVRIPKCYDAQLRPNDKNPMLSKFTFLLEDFSPSDGWYQKWLLDDVEECKAALSTYAQVHGFFWSGSRFWKENADAARELEEAIWESGSYVQPTAQDHGQCAQVAKEWAKKRIKFEKDLSPLDYWDNLGERLELVAAECGRQSHPFADETLSSVNQKYRTWTHGDPKQANIFFRREANEPKLQVGLIDFQWSGFGLASVSRFADGNEFLVLLGEWYHTCCRLNPFLHFQTDIAHFMGSAVHADMLEHCGETELLNFYYSELVQYLLKFGVFGSVDEINEEFSFGLFMKQYETAILDLTRLVIAYTWARFDEPVDKQDKDACARTMNKTSYNKSIQNAVWLMSRCDGILKSRGI